MPVAVNVISMTMTQQPSQEKPYEAFTQQIFLTGIFLHSPNFFIVTQKKALS